MFDQSSPKGRILKAALDQAALAPWADVTLADIASAAQVPLADMRGLFATKSDILAGLLQAIDDEVLRQAPKPGQDQSKRDALFEVIMSRFDVLAPYKAALKSIYASGSADFSLAAPYLASQHWMLQAAGIGTEGLTGGLKIAGLAFAYASVFRIWLEDNDPGYSRTMAALDRRLRRGERALQGLDQAQKTAGRLGEALRDAARSFSRGRAKSEAKPETEPGTGAV